MTKTLDLAQLSRRERQIMDVLYTKGRATVQEVLEGLSDPPSYSSVRTLLRILKEKGYIHHEQEGPRYIYLPSTPIEQIRTSALRRMLHTFFGGSAEQVVNTLVRSSEFEVSEEELERISSLFNDAREENLP